MDFERLVWTQHAVGAGWDEVPDPVVWVAVDRLDAAWRGSVDYVGVGGRGSNQPGKYEAVGNFLRRAIGTCPIFIPTISLVDGTVVFTDGRHRFAWLRDHGLRALSVEVGKASVDACLACFGTAERIGRLDPVER
ncbi:hypothetical protein [Burkholderia vietnamiensis]|uniref:hypothetical protein n=1 Tax=Burkholderia vietnamiensis TaxID=60552 RepID=UPI001BA0F46F|nr:hypothetical protein [Burkholderia vietnamiensis]MBR8282515.1 hypothetical protein [Burkholderia vietnamiensis]